ncbi:MAG: dihydroorotase [Gammaproteobacteria bacterium]
MPEQAKIHIRDGHLIDPGNDIDERKDVYIAEGKIAGIGNAPDGFQADQIIDAQGLIVIPGLIDAFTHLREPGQEHKATIDSECRCAAASGITTLICRPDTRPVIDTPAVIELIRHQWQLTGKTRVLAIGALTSGLRGEQLSEMAALKAAGCIGVSNAQLPLASSLIIRRAFEYAATFGLTVFVYPDEHSLSERGCLHEGPVATRLGIPAIPEASETVAVARDIALVEHTGAHVHFCHITTQRALRMIGRAKFDHIPVTTDVAIPYLYLTDIDTCNFDPNYHLQPPLRTQSDRDKLRAGLTDGSISFITSSHQPHEPDAKLAPFPSTEPGISGLDTLLPLTLHLADEGVMSRNQAIAKLTSEPAATLNLPYGQLATGAIADICIFAPEATWIVDNDSMKSDGKNTPFAGWEMKSQVRYTLRDGQVIYTSEEAFQI